MTTVALAPTGTASFPSGGGHWWVYLQYALGLRQLGCRVLWIERTARTEHVPQALELLTAFGFGPGEVLLYAAEDDAGGGIGDLRWLTGDAAGAARTLSGVDLLLDLDYGSATAVVEQVRCSALVDIDPGLLQHWWSSGLVTPAPHDHWVTTGETVGTPRARFGDCGVAWHHIRPPVHLPSWPVADHEAEAFTTVTSWWGDEWLVDDDQVVENNKRVGFVPYVGLPGRTRATLELAACFGGSPAPGEPEVHPASVGGDRDDVEALLRSGWRLRRAEAVSDGPFAYRDYVQRSKGEFSCVKPSCVRFGNAWISDRSLCYLASGRPVVVEHTGPSAVLDGGAGLLRFSSVDEAVAALDAVESDYATHRDAARSLVEDHFDAAGVLTDLLDHVLGQRVGG